MGLKVRGGGIRTMSQARRPGTGGKKKIAPGEGQSASEWGREKGGISGGDGNS